jgi:Ca2+-binding RTX toxin-like protein
MARLTFKPANPESTGSFVGYQQGELTLHSATKATYVDISGIQFILTGKDFRYDGETLIGGTITGALEKSADGAVRCQLVGLHAKADALNDVSTAYFPYYSQYALLKGNDIIIGSSGGDYMEGFKGADRINGKGGADQLYGYEGRDRLTGGTGNDFFFIMLGSGFDTITDFEGHGDNDTIYLSANSYEMKGTKDGVLLVCDTGQSVLLEDIKKVDIDMDDIILI